MHKNKLRTPIRALEKKIIEKLQYINKDVQKIHEKLKDIMDHEIHIETDLKIFKTPFVNLETNTLHLSEAFLCFLWSYTFFAYVGYEKTIELSKQNKNALYLEDIPGINHVISEMRKFSENIVLKGCTEWPKDLPSLVGSFPTKEIEEFTLQTNEIFTTAIVFLLMHEIGHIHGEHLEIANFKKDIESKYRSDRRYKLKDSDISSIKCAETEADNFAFDIIISINDTGQKKLNVFYGIIIAFTAMNLLVKDKDSLPQIFHPSVVERISRSLTKMDDCYLDKDHPEYFYHFVYHMLVNFCDIEENQDGNVKKDNKRHFNELVDKLLKKIEESKSC